MVTQVKTIEFLPDIFRTKSNEQFLSATLDQLSQQPNSKRIQGYIGSKFGYGVSRNDSYIKEPSKSRTDYQLDPAIVFTETDTDNAKDVLTYPGLLEALDTQGYKHEDENALFKNQFYSWDSFCDLDKLINYSQYYWLPNGPDAVTLTADIVLEKNIYNVVSSFNTYKFNEGSNTNKTENPTLTLVRGGTYKFNVDQTSKFWIQTLPGVSGISPVASSISTREVYGVYNNGLTYGQVVFNVPLADEQDAYIYPNGITVDLATTKSWDDINGKPLYDIVDIDGVTDLENKTIVFYGQQPYSTGYVGIGQFFSNDSFDSVDYENGSYTNLNSWSYKVKVIRDDPSKPIIYLEEDQLLPVDKSIRVSSGKTYATRIFVRNILGEITLMPFITAPNDTLYYQDSVNPDKVGVIKLVDSTNAVLNVNDIIGAQTYQSPNGIVLTNGLKIQFSGDVIPNSYLNKQYYVEGVGTSIKLLDTTDFLVTEEFSNPLQTPFDEYPYDTTSYGEALYVPEQPDYIVINRASINKNAWSRGNRWFHRDVLDISTTKNSISPLSTAALLNPDSRAKRPIIEFYPNLKLFNSGSTAKQPVDYINFSVTNAFTQVNGQTSFNPDGSEELFDGARIVFANDEDSNVKNKIYVASFVTLTGSVTPVISLTVAADGDCSLDDQIQITKGTTYTGYTFWFDGSDWIEAQIKQYVNQPPLFDIFDYNNVSFSDQTFYPGSDFKGCTIFQYAIGTGTDDPVLGFPIKYSSVNNLGDITFDVTMNMQTFNYVQDYVSTVGNVVEGYIFDYTSRTDYTRMIGWQTAVEDSFQYQVFNYTYGVDNVSSTKFFCDIAALTESETLWKPIVVYVDNARQEPSAYTVVIGANDTTITLTDTTISLGTPVTIMLYSKQISKIGYYQIPSNLDHNPFNENIDTINLGDIRGQYKSICNNIRTLEGPAFGANNFRDLGNLVPYGTKLIQNSAPIPAAGIFYRNKDTNIFDAVDYNSKEYIKFKTLLIDTINRSDFYSMQDDASILDSALIEIANVKTDSNPFFWSDMVPSKDPTITNSYVFNVGVSTQVYTLSRVYDYTTANYYCVLIYRTRVENGVSKTVQLVRNIDYQISGTVNQVTIGLDILQQGDVLTIKEYYQTYGSFVPNTPSKVGLYPVFLPEVVLDTTYVTPTYFIKGHDGSYTKLYGNYVNGYLEDFRDRALFEFETRVYNNIKIDAEIPVNYDDIFPGYFRTTDFTQDQINEIYNVYFLNWIGFNRIDYKSQYYVSSNEFTWNYKNSTTKLKAVLEQGCWRGVYLWYYDTATPNLTPWEMLGLSEKPSWWDARYGEAPYTSDNTLLWEDLRDGYIYNDGNPYVNEKRKRPDLLQILPVNDLGELLSPFDSLVTTYNVKNFDADWVVGDISPVEYSYRKSSSWPFDFMKIAALLNPAKFFALGLDLDVFKYSTEFNQYLVYNRTRGLLSSDALYFYGSGSYITNVDPSTFASNSYINWIVDYLIQYGINGSEIVRNSFLNLDVRLVYKLAGFSDKEMLKFFVERGSMDDLSTSLMIPDESYSVLLYDNEPTEVIQYSSVIVQKTTNGYKVFGNSQTKVYFVVSEPRNNGNLETITVNGLSVQVFKDFTDKTTVVPYGTEFLNYTDLSNFLISYGDYLTKQGMLFNDIENGLELTWAQMVAETLYWIQSGWEVGSTVNVNPCANQITINRDNLIVQPLTLQKENYILNQDSYPILIKDLSIYRKNTLFSVKGLNASDSLSYMNAKLSTMEHIVVFDNVTAFNDLIYNPITSLRQQRLYVKGAKTAEWNGTMNAAGFIINQNNIKEWKENQKYTKGIIVKYKAKYWMSTEIIQPSATFDSTKWIVTDYDKIRTGLLPNASNRAYESTIYYDIYKGNLENDGDLLGYSLIGYRPRQYMANADLDDITQVNLYRNMLPIKGTNEAATGINNINIKQSTLSYELFENWAIKTTEYGGILNSNFVEFTLEESKLVGNPNIVSLVIDSDVVGAEQQVPLYKLKNYGRQITNANVLPTVSTFEEKLPNAGYVNLDDIYATGYSIDVLNDSIIYELYKGDYIWIADRFNSWNVYSMISMSNILTTVLNNLNGTVTFTFANPHGLTKYDSFGILNFNNDVDGFYTVIAVTGNNTLTVTLTLPSSITTVTGAGMACKMQYQRVGTARDIQLLPTIYNEYQDYKVWVDKNTQGNWTVYERKIKYTNSNFTQTIIPYEYGSGVAYVEDLGYFASDTSVQKMYQYRKFGSGFSLYKEYEPSVGISTTNYGKVIVHTDKLLIVSAPNPNASSVDKSYIFIYKISTYKNQPVLTLEQVEDIADFDAGNAIAISGDNNFLYFDLKNYGIVAVYQQDNDYQYEEVRYWTGTSYALLASVSAGATTLTITGVTPGLSVGNYIIIDVAPMGTGVEPSYKITNISYNLGTNTTTITVSEPFVSGATVSLPTLQPNVVKVVPMVLKAATVVNATEFYVTGDWTDYIEEAKTISFTNDYATTFTYLTCKYDAGTNTTTFYVLEPFKYSYSAGTKVFTANYHFTIAQIYTGSGTTEDLLAGAYLPNGDIDYNTSTEMGYGYSLATNYDGTKLFVGAPNWEYNAQNTNVGKVFVYDRLVENYEVQYNVPPGSTYVVVLQFYINPEPKIYINGVQLQTGDYVVAPYNLVYIRGELLKAGDIVTVSTARFVNSEDLYGFENVSGIIPGEQYGFSLSCNKYASELLVGSPYNVNDNGTTGALFRHTNGDKRFGVKVASIATNLIEPTYFYINGYVVNAFRTINFLTSVTYGSTSVTLTPFDASIIPSYGVLTFKNTSTGHDWSIGYSSVNTTTGVVTFGAPFDDAATFTSPISVVDVPLGSAMLVANEINKANITNVFSYVTSDNRLVIRLRDKNLNPVNDKLDVTVLNGNFLYQLGFAATYEKTQIITDPHGDQDSCGCDCGPIVDRKTMFGYAVKFNEYNSFIVSAPTGTRYVHTTFDYSDDKNNHNDTVFDNGFTDWQDSFQTAGAVYMYDYINTYEEELSETGIGKFLYAQSCNDTELEYGAQPMYGTSLSFDGYVVMVGDPAFNPNNTALSGKVVVYENSENTQNWSVFREYTPVVDINKIQSVQLYDNVYNVNITTLDYFDPLEGKLLGAVRENIDFIAGTDPAGYNNPTVAKGNIKWGNEHIGSIWFDTSAVRFVNYHQNNVKYDSQYWGAIFPGSTVSVYTWIESDVPPLQYTGTGTVYDNDKYSVSFDTDANSVVVPKYYYWVKNTNQLYSQQGKTLTDFVIQNYLINPQSSGIAYFAPISPNTFAIYNAMEYINDDSTNIHIGFSTSSADVSKHEEFKLIRSNYATDFLPGLPGKVYNRYVPEGLYDRLLDSLSGTDESGAVVPDITLPKLMQTGISSRPRQTMFANRFKALNNYFTYVNSVLALYPIAEYGNASYLTANGQYFNTMSYWSFVYWWAEGYGNSTRTSFEVLVYADLQKITPKEGLIVGVAKNGNDKREVYIYQSGEWVRIGLQDGTIEFSDKLWDYSGNQIGYGDNYFDSIPFDEYPSVETRYILRALNEQIFVDELMIYRNKSLILLFEYIQSENIENSNYMPWLNKTSLVDINYLVRELVTYEKYKEDNQTLVQGYINEIKPYHVVIKEFTLSYTGSETYTAGYTDFDLPAKYVGGVESFVSPQLVYTGANNKQTYSPTSAIWKSSDYISWFNNYGVQLTDTPDTEVCTLTKYVSTLDQEIYVDNAKGLPIQGTLRINDEYIGYSDIDRDKNIIKNLSRGLNNSTPTTHNVGSVITMTLPGVIVLNSSRRYTSIPNVTVYIDTTKYPAPRTPAVVKAVLGNNKVIGVNVIDPGSGYVVTPEIIFDNSYEFEFLSTDVNFTFDIIALVNSEFEEGDLVKITATDSANSIIEPGYYYLHLVSATGSFYSLHRTLSDSSLGIRRVKLLSGYSSYTNTYKISLSALAIPNLSGNKTRTNIETIRFDRTSYQPKVVEWAPGEFWSSPYSFDGNDSSSDLLLYYSTGYTVDILAGWVTPSGGTDAQFTVYNVLLGGNYDAEIKASNSGGQNYNVGDVITIPGTLLAGSSPANDCVITVVTVGAGGDITDFTVTGDAIDAYLGSLQGAAIPITGIQDNGSGKTVVELNLTPLDMKMGQIKGARSFFYRVQGSYTYDDSGAGGAIIEIYKPRFNPTNLTNQYTMKVIDPGTIYNDGDIIVIPGATLGGITGTNDAIVTIQYATITGGIYISKIDGSCDSSFETYYLSPLTETTAQIFKDPGLTIPVTYPIYYDGSSNNDFAYVPEPVTSSLAYKFETSSLVIYNGNIWRCIESNNDQTFDTNKWEIVQSDDRSINALDRIAAYYQPTSDMLGNNLSLLVDGVTYPNNIYQGNPFDTQNQFPIDIELINLPYSVRGLQIKGIVYDGTKYVAVADSDTESYVLISDSYGDLWSFYQISKQPLGVTSISFDTEHYVITTTNTTLPILISYDAEKWVSIGSYAAYDYTNYDISGFDSAAIEAPSVSMYGSTIANGESFTVGDRVITKSFDYSIWNTVYQPTTQLVNIYNDVKYFDITYYVGYVAVGRGDIITSGAGTAAPVIEPYSKIITSLDGVNWTAQTPSLTNSILNSITSGLDIMVTVGENATMYYSSNALNWSPCTISGSPITDTLRAIAYGSGIFVAVGDNGTILTSVGGTTYSQITSSSITTQDLYSITYDGSHFVVVGANDTVLRSANGVFWSSISYNQAITSEYEVVGANFEFGYGPEELVAGVVSDNLLMQITTTPGSYWDNDNTQDFWYYNTGWDMRSRIMIPDSNLEVSFADFMRNPVKVAVYIIDETTGKGQRIYQITSVNNPTYYSVNWITKTVTLNQALSGNQKLMVEAYAVGNGRQLVRGNSQDYPLTIDPITGNSTFIFELAYQAIVTDPIVFLNGERLVYNVDYFITFNQNNNLQLLFDAVYDDSVDYISFTILGKTTTDYNPTEQYGYSFPETQEFAGNGDTYVTTLNFDNDNPDNLIVEVNGIRLVPPNQPGYDYTVNAGTSTITLVTAVNSDDIVAVTAFNDTRRQWLSTDMVVNLMASPITYVYNTFPAKVEIEFINDLYKFLDGAQIRIDAVEGAIGINGQTYYVKDVTVTPNTLYTYELYKDSTLLEPVEGWSFGEYTGGGYTWNESAMYTVTSPVVPFPMPNITYSDGYRAYVTVQGQRVDPSKLVYSSGNKLGICVPIAYGDVVIVTACVDGFTPDEEKFSLVVNKNNQPVVYRQNVTDGTWLTQDLVLTDDIIHFKDVSRIVENVVDVVPVTTDGSVIYATIPNDINHVRSYTVYNITTLSYISNDYIDLTTIDGKSAVVITSGASAGHTIRVSLTVGDVVSIGTEQIFFNYIDLVNNTVSGLIRGVNGTASFDHYSYEMAFGINQGVILPSKYYGIGWNSDNYTTKGDPLQISTTVAAEFLRK